MTTTSPAPATLAFSKASSHSSNSNFPPTLSPFFSPKGNKPDSSNFTKANICSLENIQVPFIVKFLCMKDRAAIALLKCVEFAAIKGEISKNTSMGPSFFSASAFEFFERKVCNQSVFTMM
ncbi:hypothetical protein LENED_001604 [Lentinula edodes]|uniref:Uncharacterized protein n=1 Tax=Lentinula edodes TaxID=5353 RepID=A0A1Q3DYU6_LENED|nr:hypothetical protein LENED_001604 [Lentinula edodes]